MTSRTRGLVLSIALTLAIVGVSAAHQNPNRIAAGKASISGRVTDGVAGRPLNGAVVTLVKGSEPPIAAVLLRSPDGLVARTDADGHYGFDGIAAGEYHVLAGHLGYLPQVFGAGGRAAVDGPIRVNEGDSRRDVHFTLVRGGTITGRVFDREGKPVPKARLSVLQVLDDERGRSLSSTAFQTNAAGEYLVSNLVEGLYRVRVSRVESPAAISGASWFQPTYYPGTPDERDAGVVRLGAGETARNIDITLSSTDLFAIAGQVRRGTSDGPIQAYILWAPTATRTIILREDNSFTISGLPSGRFTIVASSSGAGGYEAGTVTLDVGSDVGGLNIALQPTGSVTGRVVTDDASSLPGESLQIAAVLADGTRPVDPLTRDRTLLAVDGTFSIDRVFGERVIQLIGLANGWTIGHVMRGRTRVETLRVEPGTVIGDLVVVLTRK